MDVLVQLIAYGFLLLLFGAGAFLAWQYAYRKHPKEIGAGAKWLKNDFAEWFIGSWALILGWTIWAILFSSFIQMDGHFSRGLRGGSGVDPNLFMYVGWAFRLFAVVFLVLCVKLENTGTNSQAKKLEGGSTKLKVLGGVITFIVILHAMGFALKALEGKRASAVAVVEIAETTQQSNATLIAAYEKQKDDIRADRDADVAALEASLQSELNDGNAGNDDAAREFYTPQIKGVRDQARDSIADIDAAMLALRQTDGAQRIEATTQESSSEKWAPLFVGLAQLGTWSKEPSDWAIYIAGVVFIAFWVWAGDMLSIGLPPTLYKLHLRDAQRKKMSEMGKKGAESSREKRLKRRIEDLRNLQKAKTEEVEIPDPPKPEPDLEVSLNDGEVTEVEDEEEPEQTETEDNPNLFDPKAPGDDPPWTKPDSRNLPTKPNPTALTTKDDANGDEDDLSDESAGEEGDQAERGQAA
jgi:hypothetical protein